MFKNLFGGKKNEFFLQIDESEESKPVAQVSAELPKPVEQTEAEAAEEKKPEPVKAQSTQTKKESKQPVEVAPAPAAPSAFPTWDAPDWVKAMYKTNGKEAEVKVEITFATQHLMPAPSSRRRPGPSMKMFMDMARQAKTPTPKA